MWATKFDKIPKEKMEAIVKVFSDIGERDETFKFKTDKNSIIVYSQDKNQAYRRGVWLDTNVEALKGIGYNCYYEKD